MPVDRIQWGAEEWQYADLHMPDEPSPYQKEEGIPCIMLIHGGFWKTKYSLDLMTPIAEELAEQGIAAWNIEFRRCGPDENGVWVDTLSDVMRAWGHLSLIPGIDTVRAMIMGHSAGGHLALLMAAVADRKPWLTIAQAPIADLVAADHARLSDSGDAVRKWIGTIPEEDKETWSKLNPIDNPPNSSVLIMHGKKDVDVPWTQSETYVRSMNAKGIAIQKIWLPGDHYSIIDVASDDWLTQSDEIRDWL